MDIDWDKGLPLDVLSLVAQTLGMNQMKIMRGVCKTWQQGFEMGVTGIKITSLGHPALPSGLELAQRFPGLTMLDLGKRAISTEWLEELREDPTVRKNVLFFFPEG